VKTRGFRFGVNCATTSGREWLETARRAEGLGYATFIAQDHFGNQLAPLTSLVAAGTVTSRLRLATIVLDNDFRHPAAVAKEAATVDLLTNGRLELGLGAGWLQSDYDKTGLPFARPAERLARLAEAIHICKAFFSEEKSVTFAGTYYRLNQLEAVPRPVQQPRPPIMIGGRQRRMLALAGREADIVSISLLDRRGPGLPEPPTFEQKLAWVREAAGPRFDDLELHVNAAVVAVGDNRRATVEEAATRTGRTPAEVLASPGTLAGSVEAIVEQLHARREQYGVSYYVVHARVMDAFAAVIARV